MTYTHWQHYYKYSMKFTLFAKSTHRILWHCQEFWNWYDENIQFGRNGERPHLVNLLHTIRISRYMFFFASIVYTYHVRIIMNTVIQSTWNYSTVCVHVYHPQWCLLISYAFHRSTRDDISPGQKLADAYHHQYRIKTTDNKLTLSYTKCACQIFNYWLLAIQSFAVS